ncbi:MAG: protein kinase [Flavobacteriales bacterium]|nr:protein kinase [Flavobacteriales bacterium]
MKSEKVLIGVLEYIDGGDLKGKSKAYFNVEEKLQITTGILLGLKFIHGKNLIHRDLKPGNIMLKHEGDKITPKLIDFGISKQADENTSSSSQLLGTVEYMAPEQFNPKKYGKISPATDLWSFAVMVYELYTGKRLFGSRGDGHQTEEVISNILLENIEPDYTDIPQNIVELLKVCLVRNASERSTSADVLLRLLSLEVKGEESETEPIDDGPKKPKNESAESREAQQKVEAIKSNLITPENLGREVETKLLNQQDVKVKKEVNISDEKTSVLSIENAKETTLTNQQALKPKASIDQDAGLKVSKKKRKKTAWIIIGGAMLLLVVLGFWRPWNSPKFIDTDATETIVTLVNPNQNNAVIKDVPEGNTELVELPELIDQSKRIAIINLNQLGLKTEVSYVAHKFDGLVLELKVNGQQVVAGQLIPNNSIVELVIGVHESQIDKILIDEQIDQLPVPIKGAKAQIKGLVIPNSFSPDEDGINDIWKIVASGNAPSNLKLSVFNRWGSLMYSTNNVGSEFWNGLHTGKSVPNGLYTYHISAGSNFEDLLGNVTVMAKKKAEENSQLLQKVTVSGSVMLFTGDRVPGVVVTVRGTSDKAITDANGEYALKTAPGSCILDFEADGYKKNSKSTVALTNNLQKVHVWMYVKQSKVSITVSDAKNGERLIGAIVTWVRKPVNAKERRESKNFGGYSKREISTDIYGQSTFKLEPGKYEFKCSFISYESVERVVYIENGKPKTITFKLTEN